MTTKTKSNYIRTKLNKGETDLATVRPDLAKQWHPTLNGELTPDDVVVGSGKRVWWMCEKGHKWKTAIRNRGNGSECLYCLGWLPIKGETDLATLRSDLAEEWHPTKNGELTPEDVTVSSGKNIWWMCKKGHEWPSKIYNRSKGSGCPYCAGRLPIKGETDLATLRPDLAKEWHPTLNGDLTPEDVTIGVGKNIWWMCEKGHEWPSKIYNRSKSKGTGCPYCTGRLPIKGETDLATLRPDLAKEWHPTLNGDLTPEDVTIGVRKDIWWMCEKGHEWPSKIYSRSKDSGCPYCAGRLPIKGETDLATLRPDLAKEWHPTLNGDLTPEDVKVKSKRKVWWKCEKGHEWPSKISSRSNGTGCSYCSGRKPIVGENDLATLRPDVALDWDYEKNGKSPKQYKIYSNKKTNWKCHVCGKQWRTSIVKRSMGGSVCPKCK